MKAILMESYKSMIKNEPEYKLIIKNIRVNEIHHDVIKFTVIDKPDGRVHIWDNDMEYVTTEEYDEASDIIAALNFAIKFNRRSKMKNQKRLKGTKLEKTLRSIIEQHEKFKNSYFWSPPCGASARRSYEKKHSRGTIEFMLQGVTYTIIQNVDCSCKNIYYRFSVEVNGEGKDIRALKKLFKK